MKRKIETAVKKVLYDKNSSKKCKTENGSALTQRKVLKQVKYGKIPIKSVR